MIKLSANAARQIQYSAEQTSMQGIPLRIAVKKQADGSLHYAMGFDEQRLPGDEFVNTEEISLVISVQSKALAQQMIIDYVELEPGKYEFIFLNPNDPDYVPPST